MKEQIATDPKEQDQNLKDLSEQLGADLFLLSGEIDYANTDKILHTIRDLTPERRNKNAAIFLTTFGGDADAAYRLIRGLKSSYREVTAYVFGYCKSAGTLIVIGADKIVVSDFGELGPLDIQMIKDDELTNTSGLCYYQEMTMLKAQAFRMFEYFFLEVKKRSNYAITTKTATEVGCKLATGILSPISAQIDPLRLGEVERSINIALHYGKRLGVDDETLGKLISDYPSHAFVIDYREALTIFGEKKVRKPDTLELKIEKELFDILRWPLTDDDQMAVCIYSKPQELTEAKSDEKTKQNGEKPGEVHSDAGHNGETGQDVQSEPVRKDGNGVK